MRTLRCHSAVVSAQTPVLSVANLPPNFLDAMSAREPEAPAAPVDVPPITLPLGPYPAGLPYGVDDFPSLRELEMAHVRRALEIADGNRTRAAKLLGVSLATLYRKLAEAEEANGEP